MLAAIGLFLGLLAITYPHYRYFVDPDAVAYLTMAGRAAEGAPWRLINALWSPLHPAMVALLAANGMDTLQAAQLTNALACVLILVASWSLFRRFRVARDTGLAMLLALSAFLTYACYKQLFCDLWQIALLLAYLRIISLRGFLVNKWLWILCGLVMALAAYTKVYSFYFLLLHFPLSLALLRRAQLRRRFPIRVYATAFVFQLLLLLPLVSLMHLKYGFWGLSKSGALNTSWTLKGHKSPRADIGALIPPPYPNSPYTWEDPYVTEGVLHSRFESGAMIRSQAGHIVQASLQGVEAAGQISPFLLITLLATVAAIVLKKDTRFSSGHKVLLLAAAIMPLGYLLLHVEARYIWLLLLIGMILGSVWLEALRHWLNHRLAFGAAVWIFAASFVIWPIYDMKSLFGAGADVRTEALRLRSLGLTGTFTSNDHPSRSGLLAYWLGSSYYTPVSETLRPEAILADMRRYKVNFYLAYGRKSDATTPQLLDEQGMPFPELARGRVPWLSVFLVNP